MLLSNLLDTKAKGVGGGTPLPWKGPFGNLGTKHKFLCITILKFTEFRLKIINCMIVV